MRLINSEYRKKIWLRVCAGLLAAALFILLLFSQRTFEVGEYETIRTGVGVLFCILGWYALGVFERKPRK